MNILNKFLAWHIERKRRRLVLRVLTSSPEDAKQTLKTFEAIKFDLLQTFLSYGIPINEETKGIFEEALADYWAKKVKSYNPEISFKSTNNFSEAFKKAAKSVSREKLDFS